MKIQKYNQFNEAQKMVSLHQPTDDEIKEAEEYLQKGIDADWDYKDGYFYIDISGRYSVYYNLWRSSLMKSNHFISNLSTDFMTAVEKAKKAAGRIPVLVDRTETKAGMFQAAKSEIFSFGKHRGETIGETFVSDPQYIVWLSKGNYKGNDPIMIDKIKYYTDLYYETVTKQNREKSKSEHIGNVGEKITIKADVHDVKKEQSQFDNKIIQTQCKLVDENGNKYKTYNLGRDVKNGDTVRLTAKVKKHSEYLGVKFTELFYCKVFDVYNLKDLSEKFNL